MWLKNLSWLRWSQTGRVFTPQAMQRRNGRLALEYLEDRTVPSTFNAATVSDLIADINAANQGGGSNTITLAAGNTFYLTAAKATVSLDAFTVANVINNTASTSDPNIHGKYRS
jgi:hypothetical protein